MNNLIKSILSFSLKNRFFVFFMVGALVAGGVYSYLNTPIEAFPDTTLIVSIIIPLALLFAFICLRLRGMSANLLSMGAVDFGIIIDGAVVMVEGIFVVFDHKAHRVGMAKFNRLSKLGLLRKTGSDLGKAVFFPSSSS